MSVVKQHGWLEAKGIKSTAKLEISLQKRISDEVGIKKHFQKIVGIVVIEDNSFSIPTRVI